MQVEEELAGELAAGELSELVETPDEEIWSAEDVAVDLASEDRDSEDRDSEDKSAPRVRLRSRFSIDAT